MAKLIKTVETFEVPTKAEAERMVNDFKDASFPKLTGSSILEKDSKSGKRVKKRVKKCKKALFYCIFSL